MLTTTGFWIRIKNGQVSDVWDYKPSDEKIANEPGWCEAVEIKPELILNRETITTHHFNIDVTPVQIVWGKREITIDERKDILRTMVKQVFKSVVNAEIAKETDNYPETQYNAATVDAARVLFETRINAINSAVTHEDIDALGE